MSPGGDSQEGAGVSSRKADDASKDKPANPALVRFGLMAGAPAVAMRDLSAYIRREAGRSSEPRLKEWLGGFAATLDKASRQAQLDLEAKGGPPSRQQAALELLLERPLWLDKLEVGTTYARTHDDHDGTFKGKLLLTFSGDGDAWVHTEDGLSSMRFRSEAGGGNSRRTRNALLVLAEAIRRDNLERPERGPAW